MDPLPPLPQVYLDNLQANNIQRAYGRVDSAYSHIMKLMTDGESDPLRLKIAADKLVGMAPLLRGMSNAGVSAEWIGLVASIFKEASVRARRIAEANAGWADVHEQ